MADREKARKNPEEQLWEQLEDTTAGMLGVEGSGEHMQPMAHQIDRDNNRLIFFTNTASNMFGHGQPGDTAHFCVISKGQDYHTCLKGPLTLTRDPAIIDEYWSDIVGAWFDGKNDPSLQVLVMDLHYAAIWASTGNPVKFGWEILKANMGDSTLDVGVRTEVKFAA